jgi:3-phenylpropionate/trans-cinnamate dioxygenase ferredoxin component
MEFTKVAQATTFGPSGMCRVDHNGEAILIANVDGTFYAIPDKCPHRGHSLSEGTLSDGIVTCPGHGAQFDVRTGKAVHAAKIAFLSLKVHDMQSIPIKLQGDDILIAS